MSVYDCSCRKYTYPVAEEMMVRLPEVCRPVICNEVPVYRMNSRPVMSVVRTNLHRRSVLGRFVTLTGRRALRRTLRSHTWTLCRSLDCSSRLTFCRLSYCIAWFPVIYSSCLRAAFLPGYSSPVLIRTCGSTSDCCGRSALR